MSYRGALLSLLLHASSYILQKLRNVLVRIANKMGLQKVIPSQRLSRHVIAAGIIMEQ
jgi:hypothetical protein